MEYNFEETKEGDQVLIIKSINYGWRESLYFFCRVPVSKVSKAQIEVNGAKYWKKNGKKVGTNESFILPMSSIGENHYYGEIKDQTEEFKLAVQKIKAYQEIKELFEKLQKLGIPRIVKKDIDTLNQLSDVLKKITME